MLRLLLVTRAWASGLQHMSRGVWLQVLDVAHRRQVAQEGLAEAGLHVGTPPRTWSFAGESSAGQEFATVPEEATEQE